MYSGKYEQLFFVHLLACMIIYHSLQTLYIIILLSVMEDDHTK